MRRARGIRIRQTIAIIISVEARFSRLFRRGVSHL
ncbi:hypothetical protein H206_05179 [Candidatus Electrothrix aarhusensis]|uniref:Uncharacterized protein n=1 Tax=Candidatus Electrothrix aarhusensis TaxID=1859131 RepID=A0A444J5D2_9BACT|nr:hypothetical protein H206_05179 [Candidatus Electrothrix aarhusensis]